MSTINLKQLKELYKDRTDTRQSMYIGEKYQGFDFTFPPSQSEKGQIIIKHKDLESRIKVLLNGVLVSRMDGGDFKKIDVNNISTSDNNIVRVENDGRPDWGYIYSVDLIGE